MFRSFRAFAARFSPLPFPLGPCPALPSRLTVPFGMPKPGASIFRSLGWMRAIISVAKRSSVAGFWPGKTNGTRCRPKCTQPMPRGRWRRVVCQSPTFWPLVPGPMSCLAAEHALSDGSLPGDTDLLGGVADLEGEMRDKDGDPMIALIVALTHIDLAWAWRGTGWDATLPALNRSRCAAHFDRAASILPACRQAAPDSPAIAAADCALLSAQTKSRARVADRYERLISLDPRNHRHMRAMGSHLLPRWFGSYAELEVQALRNAARTQDTWGAGGYTWVQFDAIALDEEACARVDVDYFLEGLRDIVHRRPDQQTVNLLAAYCAITLQNGLGLDERADLARVQICDAANWLIRDHMTELHPMIWAHAADGFNNSIRISSPERFAARGHRDALRTISGLFRDELGKGQSVTFTSSGLKLRAH